MDLIAAPCRTCSRIAVAKRRYLNLVRGVLKLENCAFIAKLNKLRNKGKGSLVSATTLNLATTRSPPCRKARPHGLTIAVGGRDHLALLGEPADIMRPMVPDALRISRQGAEVTCEVPRLAHNFPHEILEVPRCTQFATCLPVGD